MKKSFLNLTIISTVLLFTSFFQSYAKLDMGNCVGAWLFDEGNGNVVKDQTGKCKDGKINGAEWTAGKFGKALKFNGKDNYVEIPDSTNLNPKKAMSMGCWVYLTGNVSQHRDLISKDGENAERQYLLTASDVNKFRAHVWTSDGVARYFDGKISAELEKWYYVFQTYDGNKLKLYVNGEEDGEISFSGDIIVTGQPVRIGGGANVGAAPYHTPGIIDEVVIFNVALEKDDIKTLMNNGLSGVLAVPSVGKLADTWANIKVK